MRVSEWQKAFARSRSLCPEGSTEFEWQERQTKPGNRKCPEVKSKNKKLTKAERRLSLLFKSLHGWNKDFKFDLMNA